MRLEKLSEISVILNFIKKNLILYFFGILVSLAIIAAVNIYDNNKPNYQIQKIFSLKNTVSLKSTNLDIINLEDELAEFRDVNLKYAFEKGGFISKSLSEFSEFDCNNFLFNTNRKHEFSIILKSNNENYAKEFENFIKKIEELIIKSRNTYYAETLRAIYKYKEILSQNQFEFDKLASKIDKTNREREKEYSGLSNDNDIGYQLYFLSSTHQTEYKILSDLSEASKLSFSLFQLEKELKSETLNLIYSSTEKIRILNDYKDYIYIVAFLLVLSTLIAFLTARRFN